MGLGLSSIALQSEMDYSSQLNPLEIHKERLWNLNIREVIKPSNYYYRYLAGVDQLDGNSSGGLILCRLPIEKNAKLAVGDNILVWAAASEINTPRNPFQFDYKKYMEDQGVLLQMMLDETNYISLNSDDSKPLDRLQKFRYRIIQQLKQLDFGKNERAVIQALLLGHRHDIDKELSDHYKAAGAMHIMAISGLHVGVILVLINFLLRPLKHITKGRLIQLIISLCILWSFALMAGFSASIIRAVAMFSFLAYANYINRPGSTYNILALSIFFILLVIDPKMLFQLGFQLSYAAVLSIIWLYPKLMRLWSPHNFIFRRIWQLFSVGLAAQLGVLPLSLYYFHQFPTLFFVANLIIVPFLGLIITTGILVIIMALLNWLPDALVSFYDQMIGLMNQTVAWVAKQETFLFKEIYFDEGHLLLSFGLIIAFIILIERFRYRNILLFLSLLVCLQLWNNYTIIRSAERHQIVLLHNIGSSQILYQKANELIVLSSRPNDIYFGLNNFITAERIKKLRTDRLRNSYTLNNKQWLVLDDPDIDIEFISEADIWLLSGSPRINLDRMLSQYHPERVIADGSNYHSILERWRKSCSEYDIPFYNTGESGALVIDLH